MGNKIYSAVSDYLVEGAKDSGYLKKSNGTLNDKKTSNPVNNYNKGSDINTNSWFEGTKGDKGFGG